MRKTWNNLIRQAIKQNWSAEIIKLMTDKGYKEFTLHLADPEKYPMTKEAREFARLHRKLVNRLKKARLI